MIDTIRIQTELELKLQAIISITNLLEKNSSGSEIGDWQIYESTTGGSTNWRQQQIRLTHIRSGLRAWVQGSSIKTVEASLPRLLFGQNSRLLRGDRDVGNSLKRLFEILGEVSESASINDSLLTRLDLVWHLPIQPKIFLPELRFARSPRVRRETEVYNQSGVTWPGTQIRLHAYDKSLEMRRGPGNFTRFEIQLKKASRIVEFFGHRDPAELRFADCWRIYRGLVLEFEMPATPIDEYTPPRLIALCDQHEFRPTGIPVSEWAMQSANTQRKRSRLAREIGRERLRFSEIDLAKLLPEAGPELDPPEMEFASDA